MALKPTIFKLTIMVSDFNRDHYEGLNLTIAQHPSETTERMLVRVLAYCLNVQEFLSFTKGLSAVDEPDLWVKTLDDQIALWVDVGEPSPERIKKAARQSDQVKVYSFNSKSGSWWSQQREAFSQLNASVFQFQWPQIQAFAQIAERTMDLTLNISGDSVFIASGEKTCEVTWNTLQSIQ